MLQKTNERSEDFMEPEYNNILANVLEKKKNQKTLTIGLTSNLKNIASTIRTKKDMILG